MNQLPSDFGTFLTWIGSDAVIGAVLLYLWGLPLLANLKTWVKVILLVVVGCVLAAGSYLGITYIPAGLVDQIQPYWKLVVTVITIVFSIIGTNELKLWWKDRKELRAINIETRRAAIKYAATPPDKRQSIIGVPNPRPPLPEGQG